MKRRLGSLLLVMLCVCVLCSGGVMASETRASDILAYYLVSGAKGSGSGEFKIKYDVQSDKKGTVGVESIEIYESNGSYVTTIYGTTGNGLLKSSAYRCSGTYTYTGTAGTSYYAVVVISAEAGAIYDSRTITTNTIKTPS